jgi:hypothetical protein
VGLANLGSESESCIENCVHLVGVSISFEKNFYRLPFTPPSLVRHIGTSGAQATLKQREEEVSRLNGELVQISISHEDLRQSLEEQEASVLKLQRQAEEARQSIEGEKKQVEGELAFVRFSLVDLFFWDSLSTLFFFVRGFQACGPLWGT